MLDLVENRAVRMIREKAPGIRGGKGAFVDPFEIDVGLSGERPADTGWSSPTAWDRSP